MTTLAKGEKGKKYLAARKASRRINTTYLRQSRPVEESESSIITIPSRR